ncbi:MAG: hypothetical protein ACXIVQ_09545 [Acidimicrobiales bacterium]
MSDPTVSPPPPARGSVDLRGTAWFSLLSAGLLAVAVSVPESGDHGWSRFGVWAGFAIACALATMAPSVRTQLKLSADNAWRVATAGGIGLAGYWVLFVLPWIELNVSFLATLGCAAGVYAAWTAPGRPLSAARSETF